MQEFTEDDAGYLGWIVEHPDGFVVNVERTARPAYIILHRTTCRTISVDRANGAYTERGYRKVVADDLYELRAFAQSVGRPDGSFSKVCGHCNPLAPVGSHNNVPHGS